MLEPTFMGTAVITSGKAVAAVVSNIATRVVAQARCEEVELILEFSPSLARSLPPFLNFLRARFLGKHSREAIRECL